MHGVDVVRSLQFVVEDFVKTSLVLLCCCVTRLNRRES